MKKNLLKTFVALILLIIILIPSINAALKVEKDQTESIENEIEPSCFGTIYGHTCMVYCWSWNPISFAKVDAGIKKTISTINGFYILTGLPLEKTYIVTASKTGYHSDTKEITLTKDEPVKKQLFDLQPNDEDIINSEKTECIGKIYGYTHCSHGVWTWDPIPHAMVQIGLRITRSDSKGYYEITGLPINRTYRVVANGLLHLRTVEKVTLTAEKPEKELYIDMESIIDIIFEFLL